MGLQIYIKFQGFTQRGRFFFNISKTLSLPSFYSPSPKKNYADEFTQEISLPTAVSQPNFRPAIRFSLSFFFSFFFFYSQTRTDILTRRNTGPASSFLSATTSDYRRAFNCASRYYAIALTYIADAMYVLMACLLLLSGRFLPCIQVSSPPYMCIL